MTTTNLPNAEAQATAASNAKTLAAARASATNLATHNGLTSGDFVVVLHASNNDHEPQPREAVVVGGELTVGGVIFQAGTVKRIISQPYRVSGPDWAPVITLANGSALRRDTAATHEPEWIAADGTRIRGVLAHIVAVTPAA